MPTGPKAPSTRQILDLSQALGLELTDAEAATYASLIGAGMPAYRRLEELPENQEFDSSYLLMKGFHIFQLSGQLKLIFHDQCGQLLQYYVYFPFTLYNSLE